MVSRRGSQTFCCSTPSLLEFARRGALRVCVDGPEGEARVELVPAHLAEALEFLLYRRVSFRQRDEVEVRDGNPLELAVSLVPYTVDDHAEELLVRMLRELSSKVGNVERRLERSVVVEKRSALVWR